MQLILAIIFCPRAGFKEPIINNPKYSNNVFLHPGNRIKANKANVCHTLFASLNTIYSTIAVNSVSAFIKTDPLPA